MEARKAKHGWIWTTLFSVISVAWVFPIFLVVLNSFKKKVYISKKPFALPTGKMFVGLENYVNGINKTGLISAFGWSVFITVFSVAAIILFCSMTAWYITRVKSKVTSTIYYLCLFSMIVPFQMVMYTLSKIANMLKLGNPVGIIVVYLGFGAGLSVFMFTGFNIFAILESDYLLPSLVLDQKKYKTIPIAVQYLKGGYGSVDMGAMMGVLVIAIVPIIIFYIACQRYIIEGVVAGAVKG